MEVEVNVYFILSKYSEVEAYKYFEEVVEVALS